jgi:5-methylcytosine-specific restriction endonuclease McrA
MSRRYRDADFLRTQYVEKGKSSNEIADLCGSSASTIRRWLDRHDIDDDRRYQDREWLHEQYVENRRDQRAIADECGVATTTICHWLARLDITDGESLATGECDTCGDSFRYYPSVRDGQYCSTDCAGKPRRRQVEIECPGCGEPFERRQSLDTEYCSMACWGEDNGIDVGGGVSTRYRDGWYRQRRRALDRDDYRCTTCGITNEEHEARFGFGLDVHHIVPLRLFVKWDRPVRDAHSLRNLTTVCRTHHPDAPGETVADDRI